MFDMPKYRNYRTSKAFRYMKCIKNRDGNTYFGSGMYLNGISGTVEELPNPELLSERDYSDIENFSYKNIHTI